MIVLKFGGAALADYENVKNSMEYIKNVKAEKPVIVVSAMKGVTDLLINALESAVDDKLKKARQNLKIIQTKYETVVNRLITSESVKKHLFEYLNNRLSEMDSVLKSISVLRECTPKTHDHFVSFGEKLSSSLVTEALIDSEIHAEQVDGEDVIVTDSNFTYAYPNLELSTKKIRKVLSELINRDIIPVVTGFIGANPQGETTTLGRGGTDFTASILAYGLDAHEVWYLKEVDGIMSADPKIVKNAKTIENMTYSELGELSYFGAKILHPVAIHPLKEKQILSYVKNVYKFDSPGTEITNTRCENGKTTKAITYIKNVGIITVHGQGMIGVPGIAGRVFTATGAANINILMISQSSSEQNISFVIKKEDEAKALTLLNKEFELEILKKQIDTITAENNVSIVSVVGAGMKNTPGISGQLFSALGENSINVKLIAQGSSELNISFVIKTKDIAGALNCIHDRFHLEK